MLFRSPRRGARVQLAILAKTARVRIDAYTLLADEIKEYPGNFAARRLLATMYGEEQRYLEQVEQLKYLADARPDDVATQLDYAQGLFNMGDYKACRRVMDGLVENNQEDADVLLLEANLLAKEGKREEGRAVFERADALHTAAVKAAEGKK